MVTLADHSNTKPEYVALNPKGTVPTLVIDHGDSKEVLTESRDILNWSVERMPSLRGGKSAEEFVERFYSGDLDYMVAAGVAAPEANRKGLLEKWGERVAESRRRYEEATDPELKKLYKEKLELVGCFARTESTGV